MAEIALPSSEFARVTVELEQNYQVNRSAWTGRRRTTQLPGAERWFATAQTDALATELDERPWRAFMVAAGAAPNKFRLPVACSQTDATGAAVQTATDGGNTLPLTGLPLTETVLEAGQYMTVVLASGHHRLVMLIAPLVSNGAGNATATFLPGLAGVASLGAAVELADPYLMAAFLSSKQGWTTEDGKTQFTIEAEEAL
jgi:hypothetical protein